MGDVRRTGAVVPRQSAAESAGGRCSILLPEGLPPWLESWTKDVSNLQSLVCDYVETAVARYAGQNPQVGSLRLPAIRAAH